MKNVFFVGLLIAAFCGPLAGCADEPEATVEVTEEHQQTLALAGRTLVLDGYNGVLTISGRNDSTATLTFEKKATGTGEAEAQRLLENIRIETQERADEVAITLGTDTPESTSVDVRAEVPFKTPLRLHLNNGVVEIKAMAGPITLDVGNGAVSVEGAVDDLDLRTGNGDMRVEMVGFREEASVQLQTGNGAIELTLPASAEAHVEAETQVGDISVEGRELEEKTEEKKITGGRLQGRLGDGPGQISLRTENGSILLRSR